MNAEPEKKVVLGQLFDLYGALLTGRQKDVVELSCLDDLSLSEIAQECGITRQGVRDALQKGQKQLFAYEEKLGLLKRQNQSEQTAAYFRKRLEELSRQGADVSDLLTKLADFW